MKPKQIIHEIQDTVAQAYRDTPIDTTGVGWLKTLAGGLFSWLIVQLDLVGVSAPLLLILIILLAIDTSTGAIKAHIFGQSVRSRLWKRGVLFKMLILLVLIVFALTSKALLIAMGKDFDLLITMDIVFSILIVGEAFSSLSNVYMIVTGEKVKEYNAFVGLLKIGMKSLQRILKRIIPDEDEDTD